MFFRLRFDRLKQQLGRKRLKAMADGRERTSCEQSELHSGRCCGRDTHCRRHRDVGVLSVRGGRQTDHDVLHVNGPCGHLPICSMRKRDDTGRCLERASGVFWREDDLRFLSRRGHGCHWKEQHGVLDERRFGPSHSDLGHVRNLRFWDRWPSYHPGGHLPVHFHRARHLYLPLLLPRLDAGNRHSAGGNRDRFFIELNRLFRAVYVSQRNTNIPVDVTPWHAENLQRGGAL